MGTFGYIQKHSVDEEQKGFNVQVLAPREAQIKKEFG